MRAELRSVGWELETEVEAFGSQFELENDPEGTYQRPAPLSSIFEPQSGLKPSETASKSGDQKTGNVVLLGLEMPAVGLCSLALCVVATRRMWACT